MGSKIRKAAERLLTTSLVAAAIAGVAATNTSVASAAELPVGADRLGVLINGALSVKEGNPYANWVSQWGGGLQKFELAGNRVGVLTDDGTLNVKEGDLWAGWTTQIGGVKDFRLAGNRIGILRADGTVAVKDGDLYANWTEQIGGVQELELTANRIGVVRTDGSVAVKEGNLYANWTEQATGVKDLDLAGNRIGALRTDGTLAVKDGDLYAGWTEQTNGVTQFDLTPDRIGVVFADGTATVKAGDLYAPWVNQLGGAKEVQLAGNRIGVLRTNGSVALKEGNLYDSWTEQISGVSAIRLAAAPTSSPTNPNPTPGAQVTLAELKAIYGYIGDEGTVQAGLDSMNSEMQAAGITTPARKAAYLATIRNESGFRYNAGEAGSTAVYRGRGFIQLTGSWNYGSAGSYFGQDFTNNPGLAATTQWSAPISRWYWTVARNINPMADRLDMGAVDGAIGYAPNAAEDVERCDDFKKALRYYNNGVVPSGIICARH